MDPSSTLIISVGMMARPHGERLPPSAVYQSQGSVMTLSLSASVKGVVVAHVLVEAHADLLDDGAALAHAQVAVDDQALRRAQLGDALRQFVRVLSGIAHGRGAGQHRRAVDLLGAQAHEGGARRGQVDKGAHRLALDHHVLVVGADAAGLEPGRSEHMEQQGIELAEVRRPFDRPGAQAQRFRRRVVVDRFVVVVGLVGQHLARLAQRAAQAQGGGGERRGHEGGLRVAGGGRQSSSR
ncbi:hypothetical protein [Variovorax sp. V512]|uniref:hypothetical protein n=1 Tax=Variovorax sp. V512 TaxID=3064160 RepID=UPI0034E85486